MAERKIRNLNPEEIECRVGTVMEQGKIGRAHV